MKRVSLQGMGILLVAALGVAVISAVFVISGTLAWTSYPLWSDQFGTTGTTMDNRVTALATTGRELYVAGYVGYPHAGSPLNGSLFISKFDANHVMSWNRQFGNAIYDQITSVAVKNQTLYATGSSGSNTFILKYDLNGNRTWQTSYQNSSAQSISIGQAAIYVGGTTQARYPRDVFVNSYDSRGNLTWTRLLYNYDTLVGVLASSDGVYVAGARLYDRGFLQKYDLSGNAIWNVTLNVLNVRQVAILTGFTSDNTGLYLTGDTTLPLSGNSLANDAGLFDMFIRKYDFNGNQVWTDEFAMPDHSDALRPKITTDNSGVYAVVNTQANNAFVFKYDGNGNHIWTTEIQASPPPGIPLFIRPESIEVGSGGVYVGGSLGGALSGLVQLAYRDAFVIEYSLSSSLVFFALTPPFSYIGYGTLVSAPLLLALALKLIRHRRIGESSRPGRSSELHHRLN